MITISPNPLVSVIIPVYNEGPLLAQAIDSALAQTYPRVEIIVVNDGSTEPRTRQVAMAYGDRIVYLERDNGGVAAARNTGIAAATGELIALLDQDDVWLPHKLTIGVRALQAQPNAALVHSSYYLIDADGVCTGVTRLRQRRWQALPSLLLDVPISSCTTLLPKTVLAEVGGLDPALAGSDDWDLWLRLAARGYDFYCVGEPLAAYRVHAANTSHDLDRMVRTGLGVLDKFYAQPVVPPLAQEWYDRAYFRRHIWAAAVYYGAARLDAATRHLQTAAQYYPPGLADGRVLRSFISARHAPPTPAGAHEALHFVQQALADSPLAPALRRKLAAITRLMLALQRRPGARALNGAARAVLAYPPLLLERTLWTGLARKGTRMGRALVRPPKPPRLPVERMP